MTPVTFVADGLRIAADLRVPEGPGPFPAVVVCPGMSLVKEVWVPPLAEGLTRAGFVTLTPDWRGFGASEGTPRNRLVPQLQVRDVGFAVSFLETVPEVDRGRISALGVSLGCSVAVAALAEDPRLRAAVGVAGPSDLERVWSSFPGFPAFRAKVEEARRQFARTGETRTVAVSRLLAGDPGTAAKVAADAPRHPTWTPEVTFESLHDLFAFSPESRASGVRGRPVLLVTPEHDPVIAGDELRHLARAIGPSARLEVIAGAHHVDIYEDRAAEVVALSAGFLAGL